MSYLCTFFGVESGEPFADRVLLMQMCCCKRVDEASLRRILGNNYLHIARLQKNTFIKYVVGVQKVC